MHLTDLRFDEWQLANDVSLSALTTTPLDCGLYVLKFSNGEQYVGQSVNFARRLTSHRRRWDDVIAIQFASVPRENLDDLERALIRDRASSGIVLRNIKDVNQSLHPSPLDLVIDRQEQAEWLSVEVDTEWPPLPEERVKLAKRRIASREKFEQLLAHPLGEEVLLAVADYIQAVIPEPDLTEGRLWVLTAMPSTARSKRNRRLATLSIQNVEVLYIAEWREEGGDWQSYTVLNTAVMPMVPPEIKDIPMEYDCYRSAGVVHRMELLGVEDAMSVLELPEVLRAARELALRQMRKGRPAFARFHNDSFMDAAFALDSPMDDKASQK